jgi:hypothetical protein
MTAATHSQLSALIRHRRSIKPVDMDVVTNGGSCVADAGARRCDLGANAWIDGAVEVHVVHQGAARQRLAEEMQRIYRETTPANEFREDKMKKMGENPLLSPVVIACVMERRGGTKIPEIEEIEAVACALQNLHVLRHGGWFGLLLVVTAAAGHA